MAAVTIALENPESSMILPKTAPSNNADHLTLVQHYEEGSLLIGHDLQRR